MTEQKWVELVGRLQAWKGTVILPSWAIDEVKELVQENTRLQKLVDGKEAVLQHIDEATKRLETKMGPLQDRVDSLVSLVEKQRAELEGLQSFKRSVDDALNSGDGAYRP